jgi:hypothetical protein
LKPSAIIPRLAMALPTSDKAHLCKTHKALNSHLMRDLFYEVSSEIVVRPTTLQLNTRLSDALRDHLVRLQSIASLWMSPSLFRSSYPSHLSDQRHKRIKSGCEACVLAAIGGNHTMLSDLRASVLGRKKKDHPQAPLLPFIESWIEWTGRGDAIRSESEIVMKEIRKCRRQMQKARRQISEYVSEAASVTLLNPSEEGGEEDCHDIKELIIDLYADRSSDVEFDDEKGKEVEEIRPVFRNSVFFNEAAGTFERVVPEPLKSRKYSASVYGQEANCGASMGEGESEQQQELSSARAQAYRRLVGHEEDGKDEDDDKR